MVLPGRRYVAVVQEAQRFVQLGLQAGAEAALIKVRAAVQNHLPGLGGISETRGKRPSSAREERQEERQSERLEVPVQDHQVGGSFSIALQRPLQILNLLLQFRRVALSVQNGRGQTQNARAAGDALEILERRHRRLRNWGDAVTATGRRLTFIISQ